MRIETLLYGGNAGPWHVPDHFGKDTHRQFPVKRLSPISLPEKGLLFSFVGRMVAKNYNTQKNLLEVLQGSCEGSVSD
jgi:hypothetical protein